jgi:hypothetical protein
MNLMLGTLAILSALVLTGTAVSLFALHRAYALLREVKRRADEPPPAAGGAVEDVQGMLEALSARIKELESRPPETPLNPSAPRAGINLSKRSQALRLHRRGESAERIAAELQVPRQEVDLLLKVHGIVLSSIA